MSSDLDVFVRTADVPWNAVGEGMRRQVLGHGTDLMIVRVEFEQGATGPLHHHPHRQATYIVAGQFEVTVGGETTELGVGDVFYALTNIPHSVRAIQAGTLVDVFTPIREDFLPA